MASAGRTPEQLAREEIDEQLSKAGWVIQDRREMNIGALVPAAGALRTYQAWYRDPASFCTGETSNLTNGVRVQWIP